MQRRALEPPNKAVIGTFSPVINATAPPSSTDEYNTYHIPYPTTPSNSGRPTREAHCERKSCLAHSRWLVREGQPAVAAGGPRGLECDVGGGGQQDQIFRNRDTRVGRRIDALSSHRCVHKVVEGQGSSGFLKRALFVRLYFSTLRPTISLSPSRLFRRPLSLAVSTASVRSGYGYSLLCES